MATDRRLLRAAVALLWLTGFARVGDPLSAAEAEVRIVTDPDPGPAAEHGLAEVLGALKAKGVRAARSRTLASAPGGIIVVAGRTRGSGPAARLLEEAGAPRPEEAESLVIRRVPHGGGRPLVVAGADDRGLMYALLDVAERIGWSDDPAHPLREVRETVERPHVPERALSVFTFQRAYWESRFFDDAYWDRYFDLLAASRFDTFVLIFGYENGGYFAPPYPYFFDVEGFPDVRVVGFSKEDQRRYLRALERLIASAHAHGLRFTLGIWDHIYRGGVQGPRDRAGRPTEGNVWGLTAENLVDYTAAALAELLDVLPAIDRIHFRMHGESGLERGEMDRFWTAIYRVILRKRPDLPFDARAKNFPDRLIDEALAMGVRMRITTKYWAEQMGLPFHPTHINRQNQRDRRHGYADLLRYPKRYAVHWRLWNGGTTRILLWGDPGYVRRFAGSTHLYDGEGFEVNEPLATKMQDQPHDAPPFDVLRPAYRDEDYEFERYWHLFQVFGRVGYDPDTPPEVWHRSFAGRFGPDAGPLLERALHRASWILPRIQASCFPYHRFPMTRGWVEKQRREDLPAYAKAEGSDIQQFLGIDEAARKHLAGEVSAKVHPLANARWYARAARDILDLVARAEARIGPHRGPESISTATDLRILAHLAAYHARRIPAALAYALFAHTGDVHALDDAIRGEARAIEAWEGIVAAAGDVYADDLRFGRRGAGLCGHWRDELRALREGLARLRATRANAAPAVPKGAPSIAHVPVRRARPGGPIAIRATVCGRDAIARVRLRYAARGMRRDLPMERTEAHLYRAAIPAADVVEGLRYAIEAADEAGRTSASPLAGGEIAVDVTRDEEPPTVAHEPIRRAPARKPLRITAIVRDPSGVAWVRLRYRHVTQFEDYRSLPMERIGSTDRYAATVPGEELDPAWDFMYFFEVMDAHGNGRIHPDLERETPYIVVRLAR